MTIRILLMDNHQIILWALEKLINDESPRMEVVGKTSNGSDGMQLAREKMPDIVLLDLYLGMNKSGDLVSALSKEGNSHIIIFTALRDQDAIDRAVFNGARGVIYKEEPAQNILKAIEKVHIGELWLDRSTTGRVFSSFLSAGQKPVDCITKKINTLTQKESTIVNVFASQAGASNKKIARILCISEQTLRNHLTSIFSKLQIKNRFDLFMFAKLHSHLFTALLNRHSAHLTDQREFRPHPPPPPHKNSTTFS
jgi:DNA-binding NarL/FixJ family response regulator